MAKYLNRDYTMVMYKRGVVSDLKIFKIDCGLTNDEIKYLECWKSNYNKIDSSLLEPFKSFYNEKTKRYNASELVKFLADKTGIKFPIVLSVLSAHPHKDILSWYLTENIDLKFEIKEVKFTDEQEYILNYANSSENKKILIVNAGPGTGKTTVANELAFRLKEETVLLISYTNESIKENYKRLSMYNGIKGFISFKEFKKACVVTTLDTFPHYIFNLLKQYDLNKYYNFKNTQYVDYTNYNENIRHAINILQKYKLTTEYKHIIVDEAQDIDEQRGELLFAFFNNMNCSSLTIVGDPRQRINSKAGKWYNKLWSDLSINYITDKSIKISKIGLTYSHRFENEKLLEMTNELSNTRPNIHKELISSNKLSYNDNVIVLPINNFNIDESFINIGKLILGHVENKTLFSQIAIITPSLNNNNATSTLSMKLCAVLKSMKIPCITFVEKHTINAVSFLTIHASKGKEFDIVFCLGISDYPNPPWPIELDEGDSLVYVMNSRAKKKLYYISSMYNFKPPRGVNEKYLKYIERPIIEKESNSSATVKSFGVVETVKNFGFNDFVKANKLDVSLIQITDFDFKLPEKPDEIDECFWGIMCGLGVELMLEDKYPESFEKYCSNDYITIKDKKELLKMIVINGIDFKTGKLVIYDGGINNLNEKEMEEIKQIYNKKPIDLTYKEYILYCRIMDFINSQHMNNRYDIKIETEINDLMKIYFNIAKQINKYFNKTKVKVETEYRTMYSYLKGCIDIYYGNKLIELKTIKGEFTKEYMYQTYLYKAMTGCKSAYLINLQNGNCQQVISVVHDNVWKYMINAYCQIHIHNDIINVEMVKRKIYKKDYMNKYVVDTEYTKKNKLIFDIASVNLNNLYESVVYPIDITRESNKYELEEANKWLDTNDLFENSIYIDEYRIYIDNLININGGKAEFYYYNSQDDIKWIKKDYKLTDLKNEMKIISKDKLQTTISSKLTNIYEICCFPICFYPHLKSHTALSDALMLAELIICEHL